MRSTVLDLWIMGLAASASLAKGMRPSCPGLFPMDWIVSLRVVSCPARTIRGRSMAASEPYTWPAVPWWLVVGGSCLLFLVLTGDVNVRVIMDECFPCSSSIHPIRLPFMSANNKTASDIKPHVEIHKRFRLLATRHWTYY